MKVFKTYLKLAGRNGILLFSYLALFLFFSVMSSRSGSAVKGSFSESRPYGIVINKDNSEISEKLADYIKSFTRESIPFPEDEAQEMVFQGAAEFFMVIPEGFGEEFKTGEGTIKSILDPKSPESYLVESNVQKYLMFLQSTMKNGKNPDYKKVENALKIKSEVSFSDSSDEKEKEKGWYRFFFNFMSYGMMAVYFSVCGLVIREYSKIPIKMRNYVLPLSTVKFNLQIFLGQLFCGLVIAVIFLLPVFAIKGRETLHLPWIPLSVNILSFMTAALSMAFLMTSVTTHKNVISAVGASIPLGLSFISGVMVPQTYLAPWVVRISKFFPQYYFVAANEEILKGKPYITLSLIMILFALFYLTLGMFIQKVKSGELKKAAPIRG